MKNPSAAWAGALVVLAFAGPLDAHHTGNMYARTPLWVKGTVLRFENVNPHTVTILEERTEDGQIRRWAVEGPSRSELARLDLEAPTVGAVIELCAFPYKSPEELSRMFPGVDFSARRANPAGDGPPPQAVAGHVMVMPDGERRLWEPHGSIGECIRSSDHERRSWIEFINSGERVRQAWCAQRDYSATSSDPALRELVEEIDGSIGEPCG